MIAIFAGALMMDKFFSVQLRDGKLRSISGLSALNVWDTRLGKLEGEQTPYYQKKDSNNLFVGCIILCVLSVNLCNVYIHMTYKKDVGCNDCKL